MRLRGTAAVNGYSGYHLRRERGFIREARDSEFPTLIVTLEENIVRVVLFSREDGGPCPSSSDFFQIIQKKEKIKITCGSTADKDKLKNGRRAVKKET
ncbi:hypothetical protein AKJ40_04915 [candidate division MSBL1 archaeon SCGC-AAA259M10]|uniref:Uncharacterized protein n=1 Tax=candidate division MSBL1 archaeon SCGC-AAA259M10 TaxID=1698270 RepID=A0A133UV92_9EURY|nr:hypothetical protein AKJ40_04915 [candidate division MSBL1 archaeon SCGC-AAA259M10]